MEMEFINALGFNDDPPYEDLISVSVVDAFGVEYDFDIDYIKELEISSDKCKVEFTLSQSYVSLQRLLCKCGTLFIKYANRHMETLSYTVTFRGYTRIDYKESTISFDLYVKDVELEFSNSQDLEYFV